MFLTSQSIKQFQSLNHCLSWRRLQSKMRKYISVTVSEHSTIRVNEKLATHRQEAKPQHVVDAQSFELQDDRSQICALHLWHSRGRQFLKVLL